MGIKNRIGKLEKRKGPQGGGVITELPDGTFKRGGRVYGPGELPLGGYLVVPGELPPEQWDPEAVRVHEDQLKLINPPLDG
jgi:hypothetical protein